ncbi:MAG TPA: CHRD domain-containing protein [Opitutaceae bacterium]|nr:CHRD domain-containing protein [Opitutaceae bacterium]
MKRLIGLLVLVSALAVPAFAATVTFHASITGAQENPGTASPAWGVANLELDPATGWFKLVVNLKNVNETLAASHIHVAVAGVNGPVIVGLGGEAAYRRAAGKNLHAIFTGTVPAEHIEAMLSNGTYVNFHTATYPGGATRGQLIANDVSLWVEMNGANEVPARNTPATGWAAITYNPGTKVISTLIEIEDFANPITGSHYHTAPAGMNAGVTLGLGPEGSYVRVGDDLTGEFLNLVWPSASLPLLTGGVYLNIHSPVYPGGEIRGQVW